MDPKLSILLYIDKSIMYHNLFYNLDSNRKKINRSVIRVYNEIYPELYTGTGRTLVNNIPEILYQEVLYLKKTSQNQWYFI